MSVAFDANSTGSSSANVTSFSWTHTPVGTPTAVGVVIMSSSISESAVTYGGVSMALAYDTGNIGFGFRMKIWGLPNPSSGAQTVVVSTTAFHSYIAKAITVTGSDTTTCFSNGATNSGNGASSTVTTTSASGELVIDGLGGANSQQGSPSVSGPQTLIDTTLNVGNLNLGASWTAGAATVTPTWSFSAGADWGAIAASFKAAAGGGGTTVSLFTGLMGRLFGGLVN